MMSKMWCKGCQRGQLPLTNGKCEDCGTILIDIPEDRVPGVDEVDGVDEVVTAPVIKMEIKDIEVGGRYTDDVAEEMPVDDAPSPESQQGVVDEKPLSDNTEVAKEIKPKKPMSPEVKKKISEALKRRADKNK